MELKLGHDTFRLLHQIFSNYNSFAALKEDGSVVTWGGAENGGDSSSVASQLSSGVNQIFSNGSAFAAIKEDAEVVQTYSFFEKMLKRSNVDFLCYLVKHKVQESTVEKTVEEGS